MTWKDRHGARQQVPVTAGCPGGLKFAGAGPLTDGGRHNCTALTPWRARPSPTRTTTAQPRQASHQATPSWVPSRRPKTHHSPAGCPLSSGALGSPAFFCALAFSSWTRAPSSCARCRHDLSSERVTLEGTCGHRVLSARLSPQASPPPLPSVQPPHLVLLGCQARSLTG